ncbi:hypothetical protein [Kribbella sp. NPDC004875]|uniref:hypothetical protein n=1 Tax=Kribbella sp. NPDC004875 TaxID=3364107 RepID=UPI0036920107
MELPARRRVRLWFGEHQLAEYVGEPAAACRYEAAMRRRFPGLAITNDPVTIAADRSSYSLPDLHR